MRYAAYGSNLLPARLERRVDTAALLGTAEVAGWSLAFNKRGQDGSGKCNIMPANGVIHVAVFALSDAQQRTLDDIEGVNRGYERDTIEVPGFGDCFAYRAQQPEPQPPAPFTWYRDLVIAGGELHGFPRHYIDAVRAIGAALDPDERRRGEHERLLRAAIGG